MFPPPALFQLDTILSPDTQLTDFNAPFPQANDFTKVIDAYDVLHERGALTKSEVFEGLPVSVVGRQYDYYINALRWMKLVEVKNGIVSLSARGEELSHLTFTQRMEAFQRIFLSDLLVKEMLNNPTTGFNSELLKQYGLGGSTPSRRQSTIRRWERYFEELAAPKLL